MLTKNYEKKISWGSNWHAEFKLEAKLSSYEDVEEYFVFEFQDFVTSLGSFMGLFLGWSLLAIIEWVQGIVFVLYQKFFARRSKKTERRK